MEKDKKFCYVCGERIKEDMYNSLVYPKYEFKKGYACFSCGKRIKEKKMKEANLKL